MSLFRNHSWLVIWLTFLFSFILQVMPWPEDLQMLRPSWVQLILIYWVIVVPHKVSVGTGFLIGIIFDLILGSTLGIRGFAFGLLAYIVALNHRFMLNIALWQQLFLVMILSLAVEVFIYWLEFLISSAEYHPQLFWSTLVNGILWPWLYILMNKIRFKTDIY